MTDWVVLGAEVGGAIVGVALVGEGASRVIRSIATRAGARPNTLREIRDVLRASWIGVAALASVYLTGIASVFTVVTITGLVGLLLSLSLQSLFSNILSGILLLRDGMLHVGDEIEFSGIRGTVARVALRNTWVVTADGRVVMIGNTALSGGPLINRTVQVRLLATLQE
ncbi:MAG TPA: mechanosensitive ion channel domain-containing protein [Thermoplasmata archaeon]|nr:mechanosensitive ion channel domain-containing protein [Thermoplasmata archaeon]HUJ78198.1 mechanosensitive ion channel domain-containing protein [Thermoplasmata archaeon]